MAPLQSSSASPYASPPQKKAAPPHPSKVVPDYTVKFAKVESDDGLDVFYCVSIPETNTCLDELPDNIQDIQDGLCLQVLDKPMRLLSIQLVLSWSTLHVYEDADLDNRCITKPYRSVPQQVRRAARGSPVLRRVSSGERELAATRESSCHAF